MCFEEPPSALRPVKTPPCNRLPPDHSCIHAVVPVSFVLSRDRSKFLARCDSSTCFWPVRLVVILEISCSAKHAKACCVGNQKCQSAMCTVVVVVSSAYDTCPTQGHMVSILGPPESSFKGASDLFPSNEVRGLCYQTVNITFNGNLEVPN